uniref:CSC1/OSCA1-like 7TM region domain-containing protein n=1 Tax=Skeletonema marinoi TaxID=267567 RepID=A0A7S2M4L9_9STRA|mmetsp:Transcript_4679/g.8042  ORF Transcript_4679/g.8042 Transcript_4679/m.8042 type:complete len:903 (+) Transcript_4679:295-3003(+)
MDRLFDYTSHFNRLLETSTNSTDNSGDNTTATTETTQTEILQTTCQIYVSIYMILFILFIFLRPKFPRLYNIKQSNEKLNTPIAQESYGHLAWIFKTFQFNYDEIASQCGMDAVTTIRLLELGVKLSCVAVVNSIYLMPIYKFTGVGGSEEEGISDPVMEVSLSNLSQGSNSIYATTMAAYIFFGSAMYLIANDFSWFISLRHKFLSQRRVQNYTIYLSGLPKELQSNHAIREYFTHCFSHHDSDIVADVQLAVKIPKLEKKVGKRDKILPKLEHAINLRDVKGKIPEHRKVPNLDNPKLMLCGGEKVESIPEWMEELEELNDEIGREIDRIEELQEQRRGGDDGEDDVVKSLVLDKKVGSSSNEEDDEDVEVGVSKETTPLQNTTRSSVPTSVSGTVNLLSGTITGTANLMSDTVVSGATMGATMVKSIITGSEDGAPRNAAFVSFSSVTYANLARQAVHNKEAWSCVAMEPPLPELVNWRNVGKSNHSRQGGELLSSVLTFLLCITWTVPVGFFASLGNVSRLTEVLPFLAEPVQKYDWFSALLAQLAPLILVAFVTLLPHFLLLFSKLEGLIEVESMQHHSLMSKLASFTIIQTFFISTIASTLFRSLQGIVRNPASAFRIVAEALPAQAAYLIQIIIIQNLLSMGLELLRLTPGVTDLLRRIVAKMLGHNLTEKERNETFLGLRSLDDPLEFYFGRELGQKTVLIQMVMFVYVCMSPITSYFTLFVFTALVIGFRNQFIYIYPIANDSGGKLWISFTKISIVCMIVAELILFAVILLKGALIPAFLLLPLIAASIMFDAYFKKRHFTITKFLPVGECALVDSQNEGDESLKELLKGSYLQPALKERTKGVSTNDNPTSGKSEEIDHALAIGGTGEQSRSSSGEIVDDDIFYQAVDEET